MGKSGSSRPRGPGLEFPFTCKFGLVTNLLMFYFYR